MRSSRRRRRSGADAVHPGYGFLAENEDFAQACRDAGLVFIGPSPEAIKAMGNKAGAKEIMQAAGVPCVPGYQGADQSDAAMLAEAEKIGFPVMIKAVAGGGGRGMRLVTDAAAFPGALRSARSEAQGAFGDPDRDPRARDPRSRATSRSRCSATATATPSISASATARCSGGIRS